MNTNKSIPITPSTQEELQEGHRNYMRFLVENPNNFSYWFPHIAAVEKHGIAIPKSVVIPIPEEVCMSFFLEKEGDSERIDRWVLDKVVPVIEKEFPSREVFIKNGCFSDKYVFDEACHIKDASDEETLIRHITLIQSDSFCAGMTGSGGNLELVLREYIEPEPDTPTIYWGMPLRPELRVFYDFDSHKYLYAENYWSWEECHDGIARNPEDGETYEQYFPELKKKLFHRVLAHLPAIIAALGSVDTLKMPGGLPNIWSVDFLLEDGKAWLIDMAQGWRSVYWDPARAGMNVKPNTTHV